MWRFVEGVSEPAAKKPKTKLEQLDVQRSYEKEKRKRTFQESWKKEFEWLKCENEGMICSVCSKYETVGSFITGCTNFKVQTIRKHAASENHLKNDLRSKSCTSAGMSTGDRSLQMLTSAARQKLQLLFSNAHYIAKLGRPYTDYVAMCKLDRANKNLDIGNTYITDKYCQVFVHAISESIRQKQDEHIQQSSFISVITDGATDCSSKEAECIMIRSAASGKVNVSFSQVTAIILCCITSV